MTTSIFSGTVAGSMVCSELDYITKNPKAQLSFGQVQHALDHVKIRERISSMVAMGSTALLVLAVAGVITGGMFVVGALAAIAGIAALYMLATREAESALRSKQIVWMGGSSSDEAVEEEESQDSGFFNLDWFSKPSA